MTMNTNGGRLRKNLRYDMELNDNTNLKIQQDLCRKCSRIGCASPVKPVFSRSDFQVYLLQRTSEKFQRPEEAKKVIVDVKLRYRSILTFCDVVTQLLLEQHTTEL
ncbi:hypothetical protein GQX74_010909 [Glossina fuscipes]|nr:hypothetical protein GQX74_010909 [Glossina fuscipes]